MSKKVLSLVLALCMVLTLLPTTAFAASAEKKYLTTLDELQDAFGESAQNVAVNGSGNDGKTAPFTVTITGKVSYPQDGDSLRIATEVTLNLQTGAELDLGEKLLIVDKKTESGESTGNLIITGSGTISSTADKVVQAQNGATLTIQGGTITAINGSQGSVVAIGQGTTLNITGGTITSKGKPAVNIQDAATGTITGGTISKTSSGDNDKYPAVQVGFGKDTSKTTATISGTVNISGSVAVYGKSDLTVKENAVINNPNGFALSTNGSAQNTDNYSGEVNITVEGGTITGTDSTCGIYLPAGKLTVKDDAKISGGAGIVVRGGELTVAGGTITATATGTVTVGDAIQNGERYPVPAAGITLDKNTGYTGATKVTVPEGSTTVVTGNPAVAYSEMGDTSKTPTGDNTIKISGGKFMDGDDPADISAYLADGLTIDADGKVISDEGILETGLAPTGDHSKTDPITAPVTNGKVVTAVDPATNTYDVKVTADEVKYHLNGATTGVGGYWIGFYVAAPETAEKVTATWAGADVTDAALEENVDGNNAKGIAFYYDLASVKEDIINLTFKAENGKVVDTATINVDLTGAKIDAMDFSEVGFTYNKDENIVTDCVAETMYWSFPTTKDVSTGKYVVIVSGPNGYWDFFATPTNGQYHTQAFSFLNGNQTKPGTGMDLGTYTIQLYTYTGSRITGSDDVKCDETTGAPTLADHEFEAIGTTKTVSVTDTITDVKVKEVKASETATKAVVTAEATVNDHTITVTGSATGLAANETIEVTLTLGNAIDDTAGEVKVSIDKDNKVTVKELNGTEVKNGDATFKLLKQGEAFTVVSEITVVNATVVPGDTNVKNDPKETGIQEADATTIANATQPATGDTTLNDVATEAVTGNVSDINPETAAEQLTTAGSGSTVDAESVKFFVQPHLTLEINSYDTDSKTLSVDISAVYDLVATTEGSTENLNFEQGSANAVKIKENQPLTVSEPIKLTVGVPDGFVDSVGNTSVYVLHEKNGNHYHKSETISSSSDTITFTSDDGLSPFTISLDAKPAASVADSTGTTTYYETLQEAVNAVPNGGTVKIESSEEIKDDVYVSRVVTFTLTDTDSKFTGKIEAGTGYNVSEVKNSDGSKTYTVTYTGSGVNPTYTVTVPANPNGTVTVSPRSATAGTTITVTVTPKEGYSVDTVTATQNGTGTAVTVTKNADGTYSFTMPAGGATVKATFVEGTKPAPSAKFTDVVKDAWYVDAIDYVVEKGLMGGTGETTFAPNDQTDRAMLVTILYRLDGEPAVTKDIPFSDVLAGKWYSDAINWAAANEIVGGYGDGTFRPERDLTREEAATILYRYATYKKYDVTTTAELTAYTDAASVQSYATAPMSWAVGTELINGTTETTLAPSGGAIRAQIATILMRFCENIVK